MPKNEAKGKGDNAKGTDNAADNGENATNNAGNSNEDEGKKKAEDHQVPNQEDPMKATESTPLTNNEVKPNNN